MRSKKPANQSFISLKDEKPGLFPMADNNSIQVDYWQIIGGLQDMVSQLKQQNLALQTELHAQSDEVNRLRLRLMRLESEVKQTPPLKLINKK